MIDPIKLTRYNIWANGKLLNQAMSMPRDFFTREVGGSFPSIQKTMVHLLGADWIWMNRLKSSPVVDLPAHWKLDTASNVAKHWTTVQEEMLSIVQNLSPGTRIDFVTRKGVAFNLPFTDIVVQAVSHGTYHRGQIVSMIRALGVDPVQTDYFIYCTADDVRHETES